MLELKLDNGHIAKLKLTIITTTTKRFIFNDRNFQHKLAVKKNELLEMLVAETVCIKEFGQGEEYNQTLANVIASRRK